MATNISDEGLYEHAARVKGQVVVITGAGNGIGKEAALAFAKNGAKVVIGDIDEKGAANAVAEIERVGGTATWKACNVLNYDDQVDLFELAVAKFGQIDIVIPNAGVAEVGRLTDIRTDAKGRPKKPLAKTLDVNLASVLYSAQLAVHYLRKNKDPKSLKALVFMGSVASINGLPIAPVYSAAKHGVMGLTRSLSTELAHEGIRVVIVAPWFAETAILVDIFKAVFMSGIPFVPVSRVAGAIFLAATDATPNTQGATYSLPDEKEVFRIPHMQIDGGLYELLGARVNRVFGLLQTIKTFIAFSQLFLRPLSKVAIVLGIVYFAYQQAAARGLL